MKTAKILSLGLLTIGLAAIGCGSTTGNDSDSGTGGSGTDSDGNTGGSGTDSDGSTGGNGTDSGTDSGLGGNAGADGGDGSGASSNSGGSGQNGTGGISLPDDVEFEYDPSKDMEPETCADVQIDSEEVFLDMFVILDKSLSMGGDCDVGDTDGSRWCNSINALYGFFADSTTAGTGVSFGTFSGNSCSPFTPGVPFGLIELDDSNGHLEDLEDYLNGQSPTGYTNTEAAVETLIQQTAAHTPSGTRRTISVLITDGAPTRCPDMGTDDDEAHLTELASLNDLLVEHYTDTDIPTFIIGMDDPQIQSDKLETLAAGAGAEVHTDYCLSGDSDCSYYSVPSDGNKQVFLDALESIRGSVLGCEYVVPSSQVGISDLDTLDVQFTPEESAAAIGLTRVANEAACAAADEFFVDLSGTDPIVKLCPATCDLRGEGASVDISLKCEGS